MDKLAFLRQLPWSSLAISASCTNEELMLHCRHSQQLLCSCYSTQLLHITFLSTNMHPRHQVSHKHATACIYQEACAQTTPPGAANR